MASEKDPLTTEQVTRCGDDFKTHYRTNLFKIKTDPLDFHLVLEFERIYTDLVLLRNEQGTMKKIPLDYKELLKTKVNGELPKRLMVEGEGGAGKTTFCTKIAWDWTNGADDFQEFVWVLVIPLRDIERNQTVGDIAKTYLSDSNPVQPHQIDEHILANPSKVFIILDGLDEYDGDLVKQGNDIAKIIRSDKFKECRVLVTTRPWKADQIKSNANFMKTYAFIAVAGFDKRHISIYINKYFADDSSASRDLVKLIVDNDVIQENMAPFPIYIAMLCVLWRDSDSKKREIIRRLKTFSQLFKEILISLKDHYVSKQVTDLDIETDTHYTQLDFCFSQIGKIALYGIINRQLVYEKVDFSSCEESMETCCKVGVLSHETRLVRRQDRHIKSTNLVKANVFFPHKLFQEYFAGMYLASLFESGHKQYEEAMNDVIKRAEEFRYLLYFTASQKKSVATDVTSRLIKMGHLYRHILVDVTFEAYDGDAAKVVGQHLFAEEKSLKIDDGMSAHTVSGYLFIMEKLTMETLIVSRRSCGPTVSRDLADVICSSTALTALELSGTAFHADFYDTLESEVKTPKVWRILTET
ncbi:protein NLRC5-like [Strongylocentrotus purpuratus]|uniref:NACHT domain-containing protein n=1 Tax=Strongylocentrotus purpuratus TaxID=7668 RepID=A0A7M7PCH2_STRPU|nr:protein NLRC5-like [Strongylocentrotus purpuratus]